MTVGDKRIFTFMSQALGLMADLDLGTEHLRWMGDTRFMVGFFQGLIRMKPCPVTLHIKVAESNKEKMVEEFLATRNSGTLMGSNSSTDALENEEELSADSLPPLKYNRGEPTAEDGWITFDKPMVYLYAGKSPYVGRGLMQFPVACASDGLIDIVAHELSTRKDLLGCLDDAEKGASFWRDTTHYFKAHAYRVTPHASTGNLSVDGEAYPFGPFQVEVHQGLATFLSPFGRYAADFDLPKPETSNQQSREQESDESDEEVSILLKKKPKSKIFCCFPG